MPRTYILKDQTKRSEQSRAAIKARWAKRRELAQSTNCQDRLLLKIELAKAKKELERLSNASEVKSATLSQPPVQNAPQSQPATKDHLPDFKADYYQLLADLKNPRSGADDYNAFNITSGINRLFTKHQA